MKVKVRHIDDVTPVDFCECEFNELAKVISLVEQSGGFYAKDSQQPFHSYQLVYEENAVAFAEILLGDDSA